MFSLDCAEDTGILMMKMTREVGVLAIFVVSVGMTWNIF